MDACRACSRFFHIVPAPVRSLIGHERVLTADEQRRIEESAQSCQLCRFILTEIQPHKDVRRYDSDVNHRFDNYDRQITMRTWSNFCELKADENRISSFRWMLNDGSMRFCHVWTDQSNDDGIEADSESTPSFGGFVDWPPVIHHSPAEFHSATRRLLDNCVEHHSSCRLSAAATQESVELPSRVISLQNTGGVLSARLLETKGLTGTYCALSHCWGSKDKQPLRTTRENIRNHLSSIPWSRLPSTFRDAINLVSDLGLDYIWIDSLCIIQDDSTDWKNEATRMASVYRNATIVIAAANSKDSTEGLVGPQLSLPLTFRCPITVHNGSKQSCHQVTIAAKPRRSNFPLVGPLRERAWAFQEWYLAPRTVFFTSHGIKWKCNEKELDADGMFEDLDINETISWLSLLDEYSDKQLTIPSDRIIALRGIVAKLEEDRDDHFATELGVWEHGLAEQLLWRHLDSPRNDFPGLPSWCWAATGGRKHWVTKLSDDCLSSTVVNDTMQTIILTQSGSLTASGLLVRAITPSSCFRECCLPEPTHVVSLEDGIRPGYCGEKDHAERFPIYHVGGTHSILGIGTFDNCAYPPEYFCFILSFEKRSVLDPFYYVSESEDFESRDCEHSGSQYRDSECGDSERGKPKRGDSESSNSESAHPESEDYESGDYEFEVFESGGSEFLSYETEEELATQTEKLGADSEGAGAEGNGGDVESTDESYSPYAQEDVHECPDLSEVEMSLGAYWSLLLEPVDDTMRRFRRVGMALIYPRGLKTIDYEVKTFEIV